MSDWVCTLSQKTKLALAEDQKTPQDLLVELAYDEDLVVRREVARNIKTPRETLSKLMQDKYFVVRAAAEHNPSVLKSNQSSVAQ